MSFTCFSVRRRAGGPAAIVPTVALAALLGTGTAFAGSLTNPDFSAGFDGWSGQTIACNADCDGSDDVIVDLAPPGAFGGNFSVVDDTATLTTSFTNNSVYIVSLFQIFEVDALMGRATSLLLHYVLGIKLSNPTDLAPAFLATTDGLQTALLVPGAGPLDITAFAGHEAQLTFGITDFDDIPDSLTISGLAIEQVSVPVPGTLLLLLTGFGLLALHRV